MGKGKRNHRDRHPELPAGVPAESRYVNTTTLDQDLVTRTCRYTVSKPMVILYRLVGGLMVAAGLAYFFLLHGDLVASFCVALLGAIFLHQQAHFADSAAKRTMRELRGVDEKALTHTYYFTGEEFGVVMGDGSRRSFPCSAISAIHEDERAFVIMLDQHAGAISIDKRGFLRGNAADFGESLRHKALEAGARLHDTQRGRSTTK